MKQVSVIIPCRNEEQFITTVINNLLDQDYPKNYLEVFFVDGNSEDSTKKIISDYSTKYHWMKILDNPKKIVPTAMNLAIKESKGEIIIRLDAHSAYPNNYISSLVSWQQKLNADNVGGIWITKPSDNKLKSLAISINLSHPFGVGNSLFRIGVSEPIQTDTVPFGCYKREVFNKIGYYDERLVRNQDIELNKRLTNSGGKIFLVPDIYCTYFARNTFFKLFQNNYKNGEWAILTFYYTKTISSLSIRHFIPLFFVSYLILSPMLFQMSALFLVPILVYSVASLFFSIKIAFNSNKIVLLPLLVYGFFILHFSYGLGSIIGLISALKLKLFTNV